MSDRSPLLIAAPEPPAIRRDAAGRIDYDAYRRSAASLRTAAMERVLRGLWRILTVQPEPTRRLARRPRLHVAEEVF